MGSAVWFSGRPDLDEVEAQALPAHMAQVVRVKQFAGRAAARAVRRPLRTAGAVAGCGLRDTLAFLEWLDTAEALGVRRVLTPDGSEHRFNALLDSRPPASVPEAATPAKEVGEDAIGVVVLARNEEALLPGCLESLRDVAAQVVVVDDHSTDATVRIAQDAGAEVVTRALNRDFAGQMNAGLERLRTRWALSFDADMVVDPDLAATLRAVAPLRSFDAAFIHVRSWLEGRSDLVLWPDTQSRFHLTSLRWGGTVHPVLRCRRPIYLPANGPHIEHRIPRARFLRAAIFYASIDPTPYPEGVIEGYRAELERLEAQDRGRA